MSSVAVPAAVVAQHVLTVRGLSKAFGSVPVLHDVDLDVAAGEVHGLLGVNGSGKSTLIKCLTGLHRPDAGAMELLGEPLTADETAVERWRRGLRVLHQDVGVVGSLTVLENLFVTRYSTTRLRSLDRRRMEARAREQLEVVGLQGIAPEQRAETLGPAERTLLGIARVLGDVAHRGPKVVILDEPTATLPRHDIDRLFSVIRSVAGLGASFVFVTHELEEVLELTDRVTVLRDGEVAGSAVTASLDASSLVRMIVGRDVPRATVGQNDDAGRVVLTVTGLRSATVRDFGMQLHAGEVVGMTGLVGAGHEEVPYLIAGARPAEAIEVVCDQARSTAPTPIWARRAGVSLLAADRARESGIPRASVRENATLGNLKALSSWRGIDFAAERSAVDRIIRDFRVRAPGPDAALHDLSGGNQQKVLLGRVATAAAKVILLHSPTQGVDVGARREIFDMVRALAAAGVAVLYVSNDHAELGQVCDRVLVLRRGRTVAELDNAAATHHALLSAASTG